MLPEPACGTAMATVADAAMAARTFIGNLKVHRTTSSAVCHSSCQLGGQKGEAICASGAAEPALDGPPLRAVT